MMPSLSNNQRPDTPYSCWLTADSVQARVGPLSSQPRVPEILSRSTVQSSTAPRAPALCRKSIVATAAIQPSQASRRG